MIFPSKRSTVFSYNLGWWWWWWGAECRPGRRGLPAVTMDRCNGLVSAHAAQLAQECCVTRRDRERPDVERQASAEICTRLWIWALTLSTQSYQQHLLDHTTATFADSLSCAFCTWIPNTTQYFNVVHCAVTEG